MSGISFDPQKMERLLKKDALLCFVVNDLVTNRKHAREYALELVFNGYVLEDLIMEDLYMKA